MATAAGKSTTNASVSNFYNYSHAVVVTVQYGGVITKSVDLYEDKDYYQSIYFSTRVYPNVITLNFDISVGGTGSGNVNIYTSENSGTWTLRHSTTAIELSDFSITGLDYNDTLRVRIDTQAITFKGAWRSVTCGISGGSFTTGTGTVSVGTTWSLNVQVGI